MNTVHLSKAIPTKVENINNLFNQLNEIFLKNPTEYRREIRLFITWAKKYPDVWDVIIQKVKHEVSIINRPENVPDIDIVCAALYIIGRNNSSESLLLMLAETDDINLMKQCL